MTTETNNQKPEVKTNPNPFSKINTFYLGGFKAFKDVQEIPIRPITLVFGQNSAGKSSLVKGLKLAITCDYTKIDSNIFLENNLNCNSEKLVFGIKSNSKIFNNEYEFLNAIGEVSNLNKHDPKYIESIVETTLIQKFEKNQNGCKKNVIIEQDDFKLELSNLISWYIKSAEDYGKALSLKKFNIVSYESGSDTNGINIINEAIDSTSTKLNKAEKVAFLKAIKEGINNAQITINENGQIEIIDLLENSLNEFWLRENAWHSQLEEKDNLIQKFKIKYAERIKYIESENYQLLNDSYDENILYFTKIIAKNIKDLNRKDYSLLAGLAHMSVMGIIADFGLRYCNIISNIHNTKIKILHLDSKRISLSDITEQTTDSDKAWLVYISANTTIEKINDWLQDKNKLATNYKIWKSVLLKSKKDLEKVLNNEIDENHVEWGTTAGLRIIDVRLNNRLLNFSDVGYGIQMLIPVIAAAAAPKEDVDVIVIEEPEMHLHPKLQSDLGDLFVDNVINNSDKTFILETHSENLLQRVLRRIREGVISHEAVSVLYVHPGVGEEGARVERLKINEDGKFLDRWPDGFFEPRMNDVLTGLK